MTRSWMTKYCVTEQAHKQYCDLSSHSWQISFDHFFQKWRSFCESGILTNNTYNEHALILVWHVSGNYNSYRKGWIFITIHEVNVGSRVFVRNDCFFVWYRVTQLYFQIARYTIYLSSLDWKRILHSSLANLRVAYYLKLLNYWLAL